MTRLPRLRARELIRALERVGFQVQRTRGSHVRLKHPVAELPPFLPTLAKQSALGFFERSFATWKSLWTTC